MPVTTPNVIRASAVEIWHGSKMMTLEERLKDLLGVGSETFPLQDSWRRTAGYLQHNPLLKAYALQQEAERAFERKLADYWAASGTSSGNTE